MADPGRFERGLSRGTANHVPLTPLSFLDRAAAVYPETTLRPGGPGVSEPDLIAWCRARMAHFKAPRRAVFAPLPKTSTGKIQKYLLRERARELP